MTTLIETLQQKWKLLEHGKKSNEPDLEIPTIRLDISTANGNIRLSSDENRRLKILIPVGMTDKMPIEIETHGISFGFYKYLVNQSMVKFAVLSCNEQELNQVFQELATDIVRRISTGTGAIQSISEAIKEFRKLVLKTKSTAKKETAIGLIGELLWLNELLILDRELCDAWLGPSYASHDFFKGHTAFGTAFD